MKIHLQPLPETGPSRTDDRWRAPRLLEAPHRLGFFAAGTLFATIAGWWCVLVATRWVGFAVPWALPPAVAHGVLMAGGFMPLFIVGFLFTAGPRWLSLPPVPASSLRWPVVAMVAGAWLLLVGAHVSTVLAAIGIAILAAGWTALAVRFAMMLRASGVRDRLHPRGVAAAGAVGAVACWLAAAAIAVEAADVARAAVLVMVWGWLAPTFAAVSHRMLPFFTHSAIPALDAWRPDGVLAVMLALLAASGAAAVAEVFWWPLPAAFRWLQVAVEAPAAAWLLWLALRWGLLHSLRVRLLLMLHAGFVWLGLAVALAAVSHALQATGGTGLGLAPLHALTIGWLGTTLVAMVTRVSAGHGGRALSADAVAWWIYLAVHAAALLRVGASLWPRADAPLLVAAAFAWAAAAAAWAIRYGRWFGRPRADGRPG